jgi:FdhD protein
LRAVDDQTEKVSILRISEKGPSSVEDVVVKEFPLTIVLNNQELATLLCSPASLKHLAVGFLFSEGLIRSREDIEKIVVDDGRGIVRVEIGRDVAAPGDSLSSRLITSGCGSGASFYRAADAQGRVRLESQFKVSASEILDLVHEFQNRSVIYRATGGVHGAALCDNRGILVFSEDIGRHNAIDRVLGECILGDIETEDRIVITSGRISSEILLKVSRSGVPVIVSRSAPTSLGLKLAADLGVTLVGFVRGKRMNIYTHDWRVMSDAR